MKIVYFGLPLGALLLARDGHELAFAGVLPDKGLRRLRNVAPGRVYSEPDLASDRAFQLVAGAKPSLTVSWFWPKRIPGRVLALAPAIGVHPSLLPRHRGPDPYFWAIDEGDAVTGVTAHLLEEAYDTGAVLGQKSLAINPEWNAWTLARALDRPSLKLLREIVRAYAQGRPPHAVPQDESTATAAPSPSEEELALQWSWAAERLERRVRAAAPWPGTWTEIGEELLVVVRARETDDFPAALAPAEAAVRADGIAVVRAGQGALELLEGRSEEGAPLNMHDVARIVRAAANKGDLATPATLER